ncbi:myosin regulatory light chain, smooth muscle [Cyclospora cayetanensis]|uniref:Myosin regulatory light chain, smooth muscle n=1 Tax=Cyclospora cayetanensis TaxID=88456 RepID=A0A6P6S1E1_9EIME|nr:myosin regulatory light chain, smooth muscle [Cyclospora cayetanensis]
MQEPGKSISTKELIAAFKDVSGGGSLILTEEAGNLARRLGFAPSLKECLELKVVAGQYCDMSTFATFCKEVAHRDDTPELLAELFGCYDPSGSGKVSMRIAKNILQNCGETLSGDELNAVLGDLGFSGDEIDYKAFCAKSGMVSIVFHVDAPVAHPRNQHWPDTSKLHRR